MLLAATIGACSSQKGAHSAPGQLSSAASQAHPQAVEPTVGMQAPAASAEGSQAAGDPNAHAPPLSEVRHELTELNLCGGTTNPAEAAPIAAASGPGFVPDPGTIQNVGQLPVLTARLDALGNALDLTIYGISGYRSPAHSIAVGGFADDPHTKGEAEDIGVNSLLRSSAARISEAQLAQYGLYRPFDPTDNPNNSEVNHIQLIPAAGGLSPAQANSSLSPDPRCQ